MPADARPDLTGITVLVTRPRHQARQLCDLIKAAGGRTVVFPVIDIAPPEDRESAHAVIDRLDQFDVAVFVSANAVDHGVDLIKARRDDLPTGIRLAAVGKSTAARLKQRWRRADICPDHGFDSESLLSMPEIHAVEDKRIVIFRGTGGRELLANTLRERGASVEYADVYRRVQPEGDILPILRDKSRGNIDIIVVTSNDGLRNLLDMSGSEGRQFLFSVPLAVFSDRTAALARETGFTAPPLLAREASDEALVDVIDQWRVSGKPAAKRGHNPMNTPGQSEPSADQKAGPPPAGAAPTKLAEKPAPGKKNGKTPDPGKRPSAPEPKSSSPSRPATQRRGGVIATLALLVALAAAGGSYYVWETANDNRQQLTQANAASDELAGRINMLPELESAVAAQGSELQALTGRIEAVQGQQQQITESIEALHAEVSRDRTSGWMVAEAEYLVRIAGQRLKLMNDVDTAIAALMAADERLKSTGDPSLINARSAIADDINALQSVSIPDITGIALTLSSLQRRVNELPLADGETATPETTATGAAPPPDSWEGALDRAWDAVKGLVVITRDGDAGSSPLLAPDHREILRQNLRLKLESARLAVLDRNTRLLHDDLATAQDWLTTYFTAGAARQSMLNTLAELEDTRLNPELPEISSSLQALRNWSGRRPDTAAASRPSSAAVSTGKPERPPS